MSNVTDPVKKEKKEKKDKKDKKGVKEIPLTSDAGPSTLPDEDVAPAPVTGEKKKRKHEGETEEERKARKAAKKLVSPACGHQHNRDFLLIPSGEADRCRFCLY